MTTFDLAVVGGGPAGLATATLASQRGLRVCVLDARRPPIDKPCGEGLMPDGVERLRELGIVPEQLGGVPFSGIRYCGDGTVAVGRLPAPGLGLRRPRLHVALSAAAAGAGAELRWGTRVVGLAEAGVKTATGVVAARVVVGADGLRSRVRQWAGLSRAVVGERRFGVRRHFAVAPWSDAVEVHWGAGAEAYVTPVASDEVGVALLWSGIAGGFEELLQRFPLLASRLREVAPTTRALGTGPLAQRAQAASRGRVALVGDAAGYLDAITGEGLSLALHQAAALSTAVAAGDLERYARQVRRLVRRPELMIRALLLAERRPRLRRRLLAALAADSRLFDALLAVHAGARPVGPGIVFWLLGRLFVALPRTLGAHLA